MCRADQDRNLRGRDLSAAICLWQLYLPQTGCHSGRELRDRGYSFFDPNRDYTIRLPDEDGVVVVSSWRDTDEPDETGFGMEDYDDWWLLDESLSPIPGIKGWKHFSTIDMRAHQAEWDALRAKAAQKTRLNAPRPEAAQEI